MCVCVCVAVICYGFLLEHSHLLHILVFMFHVLANVKWLMCFFSRRFLVKKKRMFVCMCAFVYESESILECHEFAVRVLHSVSFRQGSNNHFFSLPYFPHWCLHSLWLLLQPLFLLFAETERTNGK